MATRGIGDTQRLVLENLPTEGEGLTIEELTDRTNLTYPQVQGALAGLRGREMITRRRPDAAAPKAPFRYLKKVAVAA